MRLFFSNRPVLAVMVLVSVGSYLSGQVRELDYTKRDSRFSEKMLPMREFSAPVRNPESFTSRSSPGGDPSQAMHRFQRVSHPDATRQVFEGQRFSRADQQHRSDGRVHRQFSGQEPPSRFQRGTHQRFSPLDDSGSPTLELERLQRVRENTLNRRFQSVVDRSLELSAENPEGGLSIEWERGIPYPRPRIAVENTSRERSFSLEDINRFQFRSSRSSTPGIPVQDAGSGRNP
jgi:hypothetical protein